jgi:hypothetical protein
MMKKDGKRLPLRITHPLGTRSRRNDRRTPGFTRDRPDTKPLRANDPAATVAALRQLSSHLTGALFANQQMFTTKFQSPEAGRTSSSAKNGRRKVTNTNQRSACGCRQPVKGMSQLFYD